MSQGILTPTSKILTPEDFAGKSFYSIDQLTVNSLMYLIETSSRLAKLMNGLTPMELHLKLEIHFNKLFKDMFAASIFDEASTRTRLSFERAMNFLGMRIFSSVGTENNSQSKGETLEDTISMLENNFPVLIVYRTFQNGLIKEASETYPDICWINAGDGTNEHPSQTILDLVTIYQKYGRLTGLKIVIAGDIINGRTTRSLAKALCMLGNEIVFLAAEGFLPDEAYLSGLDPTCVKAVGHIAELKHYTEGADVVYLTRLQLERLKDKQIDVSAAQYQMNEEVYGKSKAMVMHPMPIDTNKSKKPEIDPKFRAENPEIVNVKKQAWNGLPARTTSISNFLGKGPEFLDTIARLEQ